MTVAYINKIVGYFDGAQSPNQEIQAAIPAPSTKLARIRVQLRTLPCDIKATLFATDTMATWFRMTGVGTPIERTQDNYRLDQIEAIETSCTHKLQEYQIGIPPGMTARATLMGHIFDRVVLDIGPNRAYEIMQLQDHCAIERREPLGLPSARMLYVKLVANRVATVALHLLFQTFRYGLPLVLSSAGPSLCLLGGVLTSIPFAFLGLSNKIILISIMILAWQIYYVFFLRIMDSFERRLQDLNIRVHRWQLDRLDNLDHSYIALLGHAKRTWMQITCAGEQQNGVNQ